MIAILCALMFTGLIAAMIFLFSSGTQLQRKIDDAPPGASGSRWARAGHSLWKDPHFHPMSRYVMGFVFFLPGVLTIIAATIQLYMFELLEAGIIGLIAWPLACTVTTWSYIRQMNGIAHQGLIFGPGRNSFTS